MKSRTLMMGIIPVVVGTSCTAQPTFEAESEGEVEQPFCADRSASEGESAFVDKSEPSSSPRSFWFGEKIPAPVASTLHASLTAEGGPIAQLQASMVTFNN